MKDYKLVLKKIGCIIGTVLTISLMVLTTVICFSIKWMFDTWSNLTMDELVYHITAPLEGTNEGMIKEYLDFCIVPTVLVLIFVVILFIAYRKQKKYFVIMGIELVLSFLTATFFVYNAWDELDAGNYVKAQGTYSTFIDDYYVNPADVEITFPGEKRNLIYIFLESMEITYADKDNGGAFERNVIPELTKLAQENEDFSGEDDKLEGGIAMPGTTWTMGAMFANTSGIPLNISIDANSMDTQDAFFPNAIVLGDILERGGYNQTLMIGSDATFGGRELYFTNHGNYKIFDYNYVLDLDLIPDNYKVWWGYEDQKLFDFAKKELLELADQENPFNLTLLTVDTHFEDGYPCEKCPNLFEDNQYANVMACSSSQINELLEWIQQQEFYKNTTIVLVGDHPTMDKDFCVKINDDYVRRVYTTYINSATELKNKTQRKYTTFDNFPTTLAALGIKIEGDRLGLGTNLFSNKQTLTERLDIDIIKSELNKKSKLMEKLAELDENKEDLHIKGDGIPIADIQVGEYQSESSTIPVKLFNISNVNENPNPPAMLGRRE
ncbi:sulfatase-like hydrolase/transferase [[Clostridium] scindens]|uniref:sulfatase-like hydrolase/transferase n=1 Tax=Clostridium scindens (strain JCM 10418 / VPI 12708) TaxID=29347 RepID=UPI001FCA509A|nr:sulfatase-like hydrolase/transferase [[Clostridium] scindens]BDF17165.1 hypothetical protein CE91St59_24280 [[Clostridium] scindens]BDF20862.1 hypothetical protein CE91St60_24450 [[Clostridium] scindens]